VDVLSSEMVGRLKERIQEKEGIPLNQQRIYFGRGNPLCSSRTLRECGVGPNSTLHLNLTLRGGMYHVSSARDGFKHLEPYPWETPEAHEARMREVLEVQVSAW
jgi:hypothetical protein